MKLNLTTKTKADIEIILVKNKKIKLNFKDSKYATGRRKRSIAKVWLKKGSGKIYVNGQSFETYFKRDRVVKP